MPWLIPQGELGQLIAFHDWEKTEFGPLESWPIHLRQMVNLVLGSAAPMAIIWGPNHRFLYNDSYAVILQDKHPAALGEKGATIFPEILDTVGPLFQRAYAGESIILEDIELSLIRNGVRQENYFSGSYSPIRNADGGCDGFIAIVVETTARIERERQRAQEFDIMLSSISDFSYCFDLEGRFVFVNRALLNLWGLTLKEAVGKNFFDLRYPDALAERLQRQIQTVISTRQTVRDQTSYISATGVVGYYDYIFNPVFAIDGSVSGVAGTTRDISDNQRHALELEDVIKERTARLQETITELESYSYSISHDLRGPLRAMQSFAEALVEDCSADLSTIGKDYLRRIIAAANRMDRIIQDVLIHSRLARSEMPLEKIALEEFIPGLLESYPTLQANDAEIVLQQPLPSVMANAAALSQCLANLIGNAGKFVHPGVTPRIILSSRAEGGRVFISVQDNGIGIAAEHRSAIFELFHRLDTQYEGTGIGLAIVRKAVERMGGRVRVEDAPGGGSIFTFDLAEAP